MTITKIKQGLAWTALVVALGLVGCGGGGGSSKSKSENPPPPATGGGGNNNGGGSGDQSSTGVFVDGPVAGVSYTTAPGGKRGETNVKGEYNYVAGDKVTFRIGGIVFPEVTAKGTVTPLDMGGEGRDEVAIINILRLLQTLDEDGDPENGISITKELTAKLGTVEIADFADEMAFNTAVADAIELSTGLELVNEIAAIEHFERSMNNLLAGSWLYVEEDGGRNLLSFFPEYEVYLLAHDFDDEETQRPGTVEFGFYEWNFASGSLEVELIGHSDGEGGFIETNSNTMSASINGNALTFIVGDDGEATFTAVKSADDPLVGGWAMLESEDGVSTLNILTIFSNNGYAIAHGNGEGGESSEWGSFTKLAGDAVRINTPTIETDGEGGLYNKDEADHTFSRMSMELNGDLEFVEADEAFVFHRLGAFPFDLESAGEIVRTVMVTRRESPFYNEIDATYTLDFPDEEEVTLTLNSDGTGTLVMDDGSRPVQSWKVNSAGTLSFYEMFDDEEEATPWRITPVAGKGNNKVLVEIEALDGFLSLLVEMDEVL